MRIKPHPVFQRDHDDLHCEMPIAFATAALGGEIDIPTLDGAAKIKVPAETQSGKVFRLRGKGIKGVRSSGHGDLFCHVVIETPVNLTERQKELLREFDAVTQKHSERHNQPAGEILDGESPRILRPLTGRCTPATGPAEAAGWVSRCSRQAQAARLALAPRHLRELQERISDSTRRSPLFDALARVRDIEAAYRQMATRARNGLRPGPSSFRRGGRELFHRPSGTPLRRAAGSAILPGPTRH